MFSVISSLAPEWVWGSIAMATGLVTIYGAIKRGYKSLTRGAQVSFWHWLMICIFYFAGDPLNTGGITAGIFAVYSAFIFLNIRVNYKDNKNSTQILH